MYEAVGLRNSYKQIASTLKLDAGTAEDSKIIWRDEVYWFRSENMYIYIYPMLRIPSLKDSLVIEKPKVKEEYIRIDVQDSTIYRPYGLWIVMTNKYDTDIESEEWATYRIRGNFRGTKISRNEEKSNFRAFNFTKP